LIKLAASGGAQFDADPLYREDPEREWALYARAV
jgi:hypothetical protein